MRVQLAIALGMIEDDVDCKVNAAQILLGLLDSLILDEESEEANTKRRAAAGTLYMLAMGKLCSHW